MLVLTVASCAKVPEESVELSVEIGRQIEVAQTGHLALVKRYFGAQRERVTAFVENEWIPEFVDSALKMPATAQAIDAMASGGDPRMRLEIMTRLSTLLQKQIAERRRELLDPIDRMEAALTDALRAHYAGMTAANASLTALLTSYGDVKDSQRTVLRAFGAEQTVTDALGQADSVVDRILEAHAAYRDGREKYAAFRAGIDGRVGRFEETLAGLRQRVGRE